MPAVPSHRTDVDSYVAVPCRSTSKKSAERRWASRVAPGRAQPDPGQPAGRRDDHHGLVGKVRDEDDRRVVRATITAAGVAALRRTAPLYLRGIEAHFSAHLTDTEKTVVAAALTRVSRQGA